MNLATIRHGGTALEPGSLIWEDNVWHLSHCVPLDTENSMATWWERIISKTRYSEDIGKLGSHFIHHELIEFAVPKRTTCSLHVRHYDI